MDIPNVSLRLNKLRYVSPIVEQILQRLFVGSECEGRVQVLRPPIRFTPNPSLATELAVVVSRRLGHAYLLLFFNETDQFTIFDPANISATLKEAETLTDYQHLPLPCPRNIQRRTQDFFCLAWSLYFMAHACQQPANPLEAINELIAQPPEKLKERVNHFIDYIYELVDDIDPIAYMLKDMNLPSEGSFDDQLLTLVNNGRGLPYNLDQSKDEKIMAKMVGTPFGPLSYGTYLYIHITRLIYRLEIEAIQYYIRASEILATNDPDNLEDYNLAIGQIRAVFERLYSKNPESWDIVYHHSVRYNVHDIYDIHPRISLVNIYKTSSTLSLYREAKYRDLLRTVASDLNSAVMLLMLNPAPFYNLDTYLDEIRETRRFFPTIRGLISYLFGVNKGYFGFYIDALANSVYEQLTEEELTFLRSVQLVALGDSDNGNYVSVHAE